VERSTQASPARPPEAVKTPARKLFRFSSRTVSSVIVPGVTTRTTARSTIPFASFGSCICSQIATFRPSLMSFRR